MSDRRPLTLINGRIKELPTADVLIGIPLKLAVGTSTGVFNIPLTSTYAMAVGLRAGGTFNVQATT